MADDSPLTSELRGARESECISSCGLGVRIRFRVAECKFHVCLWWYRKLGPKQVRRVGRVVFYVALCTGEFVRA